MQRGRAFQWPESVPADNPYSRRELKHIKLFCIIFFKLHQYRATFWLVKSIPLAYFGPFWSKFWAVSKKVAGRSIYTVAGGTPNSQDIFFDIERIFHNNIGCQGGGSKSFNINIPKFSSSHFLASTWRVFKITFFDYIIF